MRRGNKKESKITKPTQEKLKRESFQENKMNKSKKENKE